MAQHVKDRNTGKKTKKGTMFLRSSIISRSPADTLTTLGWIPLLSPSGIFLVAHFTERSPHCAPHPALPSLPQYKHSSVSYKPCTINCFSAVYCSSIWVCFSLPNWFSVTSCLICRVNLCAGGFNCYWKALEGFACVGTCGPEEENAFFLSFLFLIVPVPQALYFSSRFPSLLS